ncbi:hypothetical protein HETIRDRAFT_430316 [Heterobasidion irregulare TC 32-1]|uniref:Uncharacterized protein n=1 Tax=Heterobasidion irregulare (strain TC 32-1) TaxID=747525 RepID=W4JQS2_HETIT|nr:uncharacterized protein HETIRDRAFT_430316 [Heterobasidion irregulare TC 32-1]ETW75809.1 hypothetical protein HETIRDRAFT_430316 [Heterobasidion irregulare TC 32-1]
MDVVARQDRGSPTLSPLSAVSPTLTFASDATDISQYTPTEYERTTYYNGITEDGDHPVFVYRSDFLTTPFPKPVGTYAHIPVKSLREAYDTSLNPIWESVGPEIAERLTTTWKIRWSSINPARFFTHATPGEEGEGRLNPVVIWLGIKPGSASDTAHEVSQKILRLLREYGVHDVAIERREVVLQRLAGPALMSHVGSTNHTHHVRRFLTALLGIPLVTRGMEKDDSQGTLILWFHENKDKNGDPSNNVYGASSCHVLRKNATIDYEHKGGAPKDSLESRYNEVIEYWFDIKLHRDIGYVQHAETIKVDVEGGTRYTSGWGAFLAAEAKVGDQFEGNVVDLGSKYPPEELMALFYPWGVGATTFKFPRGRKLRIVGCATKEDLVNPTEFDSEGKGCFIVGKDGNTTDFTVRRYASLVSFILSDTSVWSRELAIYNSRLKKAEVFSVKGDSSSLIGRAKEGEGYIVGQPHLGENKAGSTSNHVTYCTPGWYLLEQIRRRFPNADFYRTVW